MGLLAAVCPSRYDRREGSSSMKFIVVSCALLGLMLGGCAAKTSGAEPESEPTPALDEADGSPATPAPEEPTAGEEDPTDGEEDATDGDGDTSDTLDAESACKQVDASLPLQDRCAAAGAVVHTFGNTCVGKCKAMEEMMMCGQAMTEGCKCPDGQCIDDETGCCREIRR
jgi:hypothetical protein